MPIIQLLMARANIGGGGNPPSSGTYPATLTANGGSLYFNPATPSRLVATDNRADWTMGTGDYTIEWWQWSLNNSNSNARLFSVGNWPNARLSLSLESGTAYFWAEGSGGNNNQVGNFTYDATALFDTWTHVAISRNSGWTRIFFNGAMVWNGNTSYDMATEDSLYIGNEPALDAAFSGYIKDFRVNKGLGLYTSNFTPTVQPLSSLSQTTLLLSVSGSGTAYTDATGRHTLYDTTAGYAEVGPYDLSLHVDAGDLGSYDSGVSSTAWNDLSPSNHHLTLTNATHYSTQGGFLAFGTDGFAVGPSAIATAQNGKTPRASISFWANVSNTGGYQHIAGFRGAEMFHVLHWGGSAVMECRVDTGGDGGVYDLYPNITNQLGNWVHYAFVVNGNRSDVYVNGSLLSTNDTITGNYDQLLGDFGIGKINNDYPATNLSMGELRYYNRARSPKEIAREFADTRTRYGV